MENAPYIILGWYFIIAILILAFILLITSIIFIHKGKKKNEKRTRLLGRICLVLGIICSIPIIALVVFILYYYIG